MSTDWPPKRPTSDPGGLSAPAGPAAATRWPVEAIRDAVRPVLPEFTIEILSETDSTNSELMRRARAGRLEPVLLVAEHQTAGRGRLGRTWSSGPRGALPSSLTFSLGLSLAPADWSGLSLAVGVSLAESLHPRIQLKWPNDLWVGDRKLAGVLIETASFGGAGGRRYTVIGIGINIAAPETAGFSIPPMALQELMPEAQSGDVLLRVTAPLVQALHTFESSGFAAFQARFAARDALRDRPVVLSDGAAGIARGVDQAGGLQVHTDRGVRTVTSSEVSVRPAV